MINGSNTTEGLFQFNIKIVISCIIYRNIIRKKMIPAVPATFDQKTPDDYPEQRKEKIRQKKALIVSAFFDNYIIIIILFYPVPELVSSDK